MDTAPWPPQAQAFEGSNKQGTTTNNKGNLERKIGIKKGQVVNCPRCNSTNTKFCYYNNYSLTQPRYFCKTCRRYWTEGGSLRNIPVGGGSRKNKRSNYSNLSCTKSPPADLISPHHQNPNHKIQQQGHDLNLSFPSNSPLQIPLPLNSNININKTQISSSSCSCSNNNNNMNNNGSSVHHEVSAMELLTGFNSFMPMDHQPNYTLGFHHIINPVPMDQFKPQPITTLSFSFGHSSLGSGLIHGSSESKSRFEDTSNTTSGMLLFPFDQNQDLKQLSTTNDHNNGDSGSGFWTGMLGTGGSW